MARTNYHVYWFKIIDRFDINGNPVILTKPAKGVSRADARDRLRQCYPKAYLVSQVVPPNDRSK